MTITPVIPWCKRQLFHVRRRCPPGLSGCLADDSEVAAMLSPVDQADALSLPVHGGGITPPDRRTGNADRPRFPTQAGRGGTTG